MHIRTHTYPHALSIHIFIYTYTYANCVKLTLMHVTIGWGDVCACVCVCEGGEWSSFVRERRITIGPMGSAARNWIQTIVLGTHDRFASSDGIGWRNYERTTLLNKNNNPDKCPSRAIVSPFRPFVEPTDDRVDNDSEIIFGRRRDFSGRVSRNRRRPAQRNRIVPRRPQRRSLLARAWEETSTAFRGNLSILFSFCFFVFIFRKGSWPIGNHRGVFTISPYSRQRERRAGRVGYTNGKKTYSTISYSTV